MEWIDALRGTIVGLDTAPLIYFIEEHPTYLPLVRPFFEAVDRGDFQIVTSARQVITVPVSEEVAEEAAQLRSAHGLRTPDAIQLATAVRARASSFLTNDSRLPKSVASLKLLILNQLIATTP